MMPFIDASIWKDHSFNPARLKKMREGSKILRTFIETTLQNGFLQITQFEHQYLTELSTRLVDTQIPTAARKVLSLKDMEPSTENLRLYRSEMRWLANLSLFLERFDSLSVMGKLEIWQVCGAIIPKNLIFEQKPVEDIWQAKRIVQFKEDSLTTRKTWLLGQKTGIWTCIIDYAFGREKLIEYIKINAVFASQIHLFPGLSIQRGLTGQLSPIAIDHVDDKNTMEDLDAVKKYVAALINRNPFVQEILVTVRDVMPVMANKTLYITDKNGHQIEITESKDKMLQLLASAGGTFMTIHLVCYKDRWGVLI